MKLWSKEHILLTVTLSFVAGFLFPIAHKRFKSWKATRPHKLRSIDSFFNAFNVSKRLKFEAFKKKNAVVIKSWLKNNPGKQPPIVYDTNTKVFFWAPRRLRRKQKDALL